MALVGAISGFLLAALFWSSSAPGASLSFNADYASFEYRAALGEANVLTVTEAGGWYVFQDTAAEACPVAHSVS